MQYRYQEHVRQQKHQGKAHVVLVIDRSQQHDGEAEQKKESRARRKNEDSPLVEGDLARGRYPSIHPLLESTLPALPQGSRGTQCNRPAHNPAPNESITS